jgi:hypothetical protein
MELWGTLRLAEPAELRDSHVAITFYRWSTPTAAPRFRAAALATQALRKDASAEDKKYIVDVTKVLDQRPPQVAYVVPIYESTLEVSLRTLADRKREQWTEQAALHIGRALRASHTAGGGARYHGDVKTSHILVDHVDEHGDKAPEFRLGGFAPDPEPAGAALPVSIVPECLAQKYQGNDGLGKRQWRDVAALAMILYQLLTGRTLQFESLGELSKQIEPLDKLLAAPDHEHRRMLPKIITALKDIFSGKTATLTIQDFLARIEPVPSVTVTQLLPAAPGPVRHQLRILHLSDLHHRGPRETEPERRRRVLGRAWLDNLGELRNNGGAFDLVVFTGNVAFSGAADEYRDLMHHTRVAGDGVDTWLDDTLAAAGCDRSRLFVIPGDRDIDCCIHVDAWRTVRTEWSNAGSDDDVQFSRWFVRGEKAPRGMDDAQRDQILERQSAYRAWLRDDLGRRDLLPDERRSRLGYRASPAFARLPFLVHLIGLDSAWLAGDDGDARKLRLTNDQIMRLCTDEDGRDLTGLRIALIHHPLGDLADGERARDLLRERGIDLMLSGHLLEARVSEIVGPDGRLRDIATGCLYHHDRYPNAITAMTLQLDDVGGLREIEFWFRGWSEKRGFWHDDDSLYRGTRSGRVTWSAAPPPELAATAAGS